MRAEIEVGARGQGRVALDGHDISGGVRGISLRASVGDDTTLELDLAVFEDVRFGGDVTVIIPDATREALVALGWTPPAE